MSQLTINTSWQGRPKAARNVDDDGTKTADGCSRPAEVALQSARLAYVIDEGKSTMAGLLTVLIVAVCLTAGVAALVTVMQLASSWWVRSGARDVVRGAEAMLRAAAAHPA